MHHRDPHCSVLRQSALQTNEAAFQPIAADSHRHRKHLSTRVISQCHPAQLDADALNYTVVSAAPAQPKIDILCGTNSNSQ